MLSFSQPSVEVTQCHPCHILLATQVMRPSSDWKCRETDSGSYRRSCKESVAVFFLIYHRAFCIMTFRMVCFRMSSYYQVFCGMDSRSELLKGISLFNGYLPCTYFPQDTVIGAVQVLVSSVSSFILFG